MSKRTLGQKHVNPLETRLVVVIQAFALRQRASVDSQGLLRAVALLFGSHFPEIIFQGFAMLVLAALEGAALVFAATAAKASDLDLAVAVRAKANHEEPR